MAEDNIKPRRPLMLPAEAAIITAELDREGLLVTLNGQLNQEARYALACLAMPRIAARVNARARRILIRGNNREGEQDEAAAMWCDLTRDQLVIPTTQLVAAGVPGAPGIQLWHPRGPERLLHRRSATEEVGIDWPDYNPYELSHAFSRIQEAGTKQSTVQLPDGTVFDVVRHGSSLAEAVYAFHGESKEPELYEVSQTAQAISESYHGPNIPNSRVRVYQDGHGIAETRDRFTDMAINLEKALDVFTRIRVEAEQDVCILFHDAAWDFEVVPTTVSDLWEARQLFHVPSVLDIVEYWYRRYPARKREHH